MSGRIYPAGVGLWLLAAVAASLAAIGLIARLVGAWSVLVPASVVVVLVPVGYAMLRPAGRWRAGLGALGLIAPGWGPWPPASPGCSPHA